MKVDRMEGLEFSICGNFVEGHYHTSVELGGHCNMCHRFQAVSMTLEQWKQWVTAQKVIQDIFPDMDSDSREFLISRTCGECYESLWNEMEEKQ